MVVVVSNLGSIQTLTINFLSLNIDWENLSIFLKPHQHLEWPIAYLNLFFSILMFDLFTSHYRLFPIFFFFCLTT